MINKLNKIERLNLLWLMAMGLIIVGMSLKICRMAHCFVFGIDHVNRPIPEMILYLGIWFIAYYFALERIRKINNLDSTRINLIWILFVGVVIRVVFFPPHLIQETDPYRYLWDGQAVVQGTNPYRFSPQEAYSLNVSPAVSKNENIRATFERISFPDVKTIYPPLAQYLFAVSQYLTPWSLLGWKWMIMIVDALIIGTLLALLGRMKTRMEWILLYAWSPLILKEFHNSLHLDVFALFFLVLMIYSFIRGWVILSFIALACATMVKWFSLILLPLLILATLSRIRKNLLNISLFLGLAVFLYLPFISAGRYLWEGLTTFSFNWRVNDGIFSVILFCIQSLHLSEELTKLIARLIVGIIFLGISLTVLSWYSKKRNNSSFLQAGLILTSSLFFLIPTGNPWYFTWIFPFLVFSPRRSLVLFSGLVLLYYLDFYFIYQDQKYLYNWIRLIEYGVFFLFLGYELWKNRQLPLLSRFTTRVASLERR